MLKLHQELPLTPSTTDSAHLASWCGPACVQMYLSSYELTHTQASIWSATRTLMHPDSVGVWYTDPLAAASFLQTVGIPGGSMIDHWSDDTFEQALGRVAVASIAHDAPSIILTQSGYHWVVVHGIICQFDRDVDQLTIAALRIVDPTDGTSQWWFHDSHLMWEVKISLVTNDTHWWSKYVSVTRAVDRLPGLVTFADSPDLLLDVDETNIMEAIRSELEIISETFDGVGVMVHEQIGPVRQVRFVDDADTYFIVPVRVGTTDGAVAYIGRRGGERVNSIASILTSPWREPPAGAELATLVHDHVPPPMHDDDFEVDSDDLWWSPQDRGTSSLFNVARRIRPRTGAPFFIRRNGEHFQPGQNPDLGG